MTQLYEAQHYYYVIDVEVQADTESKMFHFHPGKGTWGRLREGNSVGVIFDTGGKREPILLEEYLITISISMLDR